MEHWRAWRKAACALALPAMLLATVGVYSVHSAFHRHNDHSLSRSSVPHQRSAQRSAIDAGSEIAAQWRCPICAFLAEYRADIPARQPHVEWGHLVVVAAPDEEHVVTIMAQRAPLGIRAPPGFIPLVSL